MQSQAHIFGHAAGKLSDIRNLQHYSAWMKGRMTILLSSRDYAYMMEFYGDRVPADGKDFGRRVIRRRAKREEAQTFWLGLPMHPCTASRHIGNWRARYAATWRSYTQEARSTDPC